MKLLAFALLLAGCTLQTQVVLECEGKCKLEAGRILDGSLPTSMQKP